MSKIGMVIDNDFFFVEFLGEALEKRGYTVIKGYDGKEAITKLQEGPVDVLFLDVIMPKIDGPTVIRFIRERFPEHSFPIVAVSSTFIERGEEIEGIGADFYFAKGPLEQMSEQVDQLLDNLEGQNQTNEIYTNFLATGNLHPRSTTSELVETLNFQKAIVDHIGLGILVVDRDAKVINCNSMVLELTGRPIQDILNNPITHLFPAREKSAIITKLKAVAQNQELKKVCLDVIIGFRRVGLVFSILKLNDKIEGWIIAMEDLNQWEEQA
jgi:CheY-like chemotaxis protein